MWTGCKFQKIKIKILPSLVRPQSLHNHILLLCEYSLQYNNTVHYIHAFQMTHLKASLGLAAQMRAVHLS
jgi:hypothetical protein